MDKNNTIPSKIKIKPVDKKQICDKSGYFVSNKILLEKKNQVQQPKPIPILVKTKKNSISLKTSIDLKKIRNNSIITTKKEDQKNIRRKDEKRNSTSHENNKLLDLKNNTKIRKNTALVIKDQSKLSKTIAKPELIKNTPKKLDQKPKLPVSTNDKKIEDYSNIDETTKPNQMEEKSVDMKYLNDNIQNTYSDKLDGWSGFLVHKLMNSGDFEDAMILSSTGELWGKTSEEFYFKNDYEFKKLKSLFLSEGICHEDCTCNTKGIDILGKNFKFTKYFDNENTLKYESLLFYYRERFCLVGIAQSNAHDPIYKLYLVGNEIDDYLDQIF